MTNDEREMLVRIDQRTQDMHDSCERHAKQLKDLYMKTEKNKEAIADNKNNITKVVAYGTAAVFGETHPIRAFIRFPLKSSRHRRRAQGFKKLPKRLKTGFSTNPDVVHLYLRTHELTDLPESVFDGGHCLLKEDLHFVDKNGQIHTARKGMLSDGGSVPKRYWRRVTSPYRLLLPAYLIHDQKCQDLRKLSDRDKREKKRKQADDLLAEMIDWIDDNLPGVDIKKGTRTIVFLGVRAGAKVEEFKRSWGFPPRQYG